MSQHPISPDSLHKALLELEEYLDYFGEEDIRAKLNLVRRAVEANEKLAPKPRVIWTCDNARGLYRIVHVPGREQNSYLAEKGHRDATGDLSWNGCGPMAPPAVFQALAASYEATKLLGVTMPLDSPFAPKPDAGEADETEPTAEIAEDAEPVEQGGEA